MASQTEEEETRAEYLKILRHLFRRFADEADTPLTTAEQFLSSPESFILWLVSQYSSNNLPGEDPYLLGLESVSEDSLEEFRNRFRSDDSLATLMGFIRWYWSYITVPRRPLPFTIEKAFVQAGFVLAGEGPEENRTVKVKCHHEHDESLGDLLEPALIHHWFRGIRSVSSLLLDQGAEILPKKLDATFNARLDGQGNVVLSEEPRQKSDGESR